MSEKSVKLNNKVRDAWFDNMKGVLMIMVVIGHLIASLVNKFDTYGFVSNFIYSFHMPAFAIISGYFLKRRVNTKDYASVISKTIVPYLFAQVFVYLAGKIIPDGERALSTDIFDASELFSFLFPVYHLWYFSAIVFCFVFCIAIKAEKHPTRAFITALLISLCEGFLPTVSFLKLTKIMAFLPFFVLGYTLSKNAMNFVKEKRLLAIPSVLVFAAVAVYLWSIREVGTLTGIFAMTTRYKSFVFDIPFYYAVLVRLGFIVGGVILSFSLFSLCPRKRNPLTILGERSVYIYILHVVIVAVIRHYHYENQILYLLDDPIKKALYLFFGVVVCYLLVSKPVYRLFKPLFEPDFDIRKIGEYLNIKK